MHLYLARRLLLVVPTLLGVTIVVFSLVRLLPGNLGTSLRSNAPVTIELSNRMPVTAELGLMAMAIGLLIALPVGIISAVRQDTRTDYLARGMAIGMLAIPGFWLGTLVITLPSIWWQWTPPLRYTKLWEDPGK